MDFILALAFLVLFITSFFTIRNSGSVILLSVLLCLHYNFFIWVLCCLSPYAVLYIISYLTALRRSSSSFYCLFLHSIHVYIMLIYTYSVRRWCRYYRLLILIVILPLSSSPLMWFPLSWSWIRTDHFLTISLIISILFEVLSQNMRLILLFSTSSFWDYQS